MSRRTGLLLCILSTALGVHTPCASAAVDWDPVTDAEKAMKASPLDPGAGAAVLFKRGQIDVIERTSLDWTTHTHIYVRIKVFNDAGRDAGNVSIDTTKFVRVTQIEGRTILPTGEIIPLDSSKVFHGKAYTEGKNFAILESSFTFPSVQPGAIIEYQIDENEDWFYPQPWIFDTSGLGTLQSALRVTVGPRLSMAQYPLETNVNKISISQSSSVRGSQNDFSVSNLRPITTEAYALPYRDLATMILFTPRQLGFSGEVYPLITNWDDVGKEITDEFKDTEKNSNKAKNKAKELAQNIPDPRKKAEAIYKFVQQNITSSDLAGVGLGRPADDILSSRRGDPDEINALFILMLKEAKIEADMVLVATRNWQSLARNFPNRSQFSRILTRVNFKDGPLFADPADAAAPFGELPWFDRDVQGLAVKGSKIQEATIPAGTPEDNVSTGKTTIRVGKDWSLDGDEELDVKGAEAISLRADLLREAPEKLNERLTRIFGYSGSEIEVSQISHPDFRDSSQPFVLKAHLQQKQTSLDTPVEYLLNPWVGDPIGLPRFGASARHSAVRFDSLEKRTLTSDWQLAPGIKIDQLPKEIKIDNDFAGYSRSCAQNGAELTCTRTFYLKKLSLTTNADYANARKFFDEISKDDQEPVVLQRM